MWWLVIIGGALACAAAALSAHLWLGYSPVQAALGGALALFAVTVVYSVARAVRPRDRYALSTPYGWDAPEDAVGPDGRALKLGLVREVGMVSDDEAIREAAPKPILVAADAPARRAPPAGKPTRIEPQRQPDAARQPREQVTPFPRKASATGRTERKRRSPTPLRAQKRVASTHVEPALHQDSKRQATRIQLKNDPRLDGVQLVLNERCYITPLWGRDPSAAFRDLYQYASSQKRRS